MSKILFLFQLNTRPLDGYPYILNLAKLLCKEGIGVDFLAHKEVAKGYVIENFNYVTIPEANNDYEFLKYCIEHLQKHNGEYDFIISFSIVGIWAHLYNILHHKNKLNGAYFSMELFDFEKKPKGIMKFYYKIFRPLLKKKIKFCVAQDKNRANLVKKYSHFANKVFSLPNSYIGLDFEKSKFAYKKFSIPENKKILLYIGGIENWAFDKNLPENLTPLLDKDYILLLNGSSRDNTAEELKGTYRDLIDSGKMIISSEHLSEDDLSQLVKSAHIGLAWYRKYDDIESISGQNMYYMGLSSGKFCKYLSCGIPVILPSFYFGYNELIEQYKFGRCAEYSSSICEQVEFIDKHYNEFTQNAETYYEKHLEYSTQVKPILEEIIKYLK